MTERRTRQKVTVLLNEGGNFRVSQQIGMFDSLFGTVIAVEDVPVPMTAKEELAALVEVIRNPSSGGIPIHPQSGLARRIRDAGLAHLFPEVTE